jgi:hypothetical protein
MPNLRKGGKMIPGDGDVTQESVVGYADKDEENIEREKTGRTVTVQQDTIQVQE